MPLPSPSRAILRRGLASVAGLGLVLCPLISSAKLPEPRRIPLDPLGFQAPGARFLAAGSSLLTVHYVDSSHLLLTFGVHRLMPRDPTCPPQDDDHVIAAVLLDLPTGAVLARTEWRLHDHGQYLWSLGNGSFLLRQRDALKSFAPLAHLGGGDAFRQHTVLHTDRSIRAVIVSPDARLLTLETVARELPAAAKPASQSSGNGSGQSSASPGDADHPMQIDFYRLLADPGTKGQVVAARAGHARARTAVEIPADGEGFVSALDQGKGTWAFDFNEFSGKRDELAMFDSTCGPHVHLVSASEFVALACKGGTERQLLAAFNLNGDEMWQQQFYRPYAFASYALARPAGRFVLSRVITNGPIADMSSVVPEELVTQNLTVYQIDSGRQLLTVEFGPAARAGQNFALAPDGLSLALVREGVLEIYPLPPLSKGDLAAVHKAASFAPAGYEGPVRLDAPVTNARDSHAPPNPRVAAVPPPATPYDRATAAQPLPAASRSAIVADPDQSSTAAAAPSQAASAATTGSTHIPDAGTTAASQQKNKARVVMGDQPAPAEGHRKPPTLYGPPAAPESPGTPQ